MHGSLVLRAGLGSLELKMAPNSRIASPFRTRDISFPKSSTAPLAPRKYSTPRVRGNKTVLKATSKDGHPDHGKVEWLKSMLSERGMDKKLAQQVLKVWSVTGTESAEVLRESLVGRSLKMVGSNAFQLCVDIGAAYGAFNTAAALMTDEATAAATAGYWMMMGLGAYLTVGVLMDSFSLFVLLLMTYFYQTSSQSVMEAVRELAGESPISVLDKTRTALTMANVSAAMDKLRSILKEDAEKLADQDNTLQHLQSYIVLQHAKEDLGFDAAKYGLSEMEASKIALEFDKYDVDNDGKLDIDDLQRLCESFDSGLKGDEVRTAWELMDCHKQGYIDFEEFVSWWTTKVNNTELGRKHDAAQP